MRKFKHLDIHDGVILRELLIDDNFKKKNGTINLAKIARYMGRNKNNISYELKHYTQIVNCKCKCSTFYMNENLIFKLNS